MITDEYCFRRFFGPADIELIQFSEQEGLKQSKSVGRIRKSNKISAHEFFTYLKNPLQVSIVKESLTEDLLILPKIKETDPQIGMLHLVYKPEDSKIVRASRKILGTKKLKSRRRRKRK